MIALSNRIAGARRAAVSGRTLDDLCPATGALDATMPRSEAEDVEMAVAAAREAQPIWGDTPVEQRARVLERVADGLEARADDVAALESRDQGKPVRLARAVDAVRAAANFRFFASLIRTEHLPATTEPRGWHHTVRQPAGVVGLITPWNLPLYLLTWKLAPALACGNGVVAKPSELTPRTADLLWDVLEEAGVPVGVANLVHGLGAEAGAPLVAHPDVDVVSFTGGTATGRAVAAAAAPTFKKLSLELGGKNPTVLLPDADLEAASHGAAKAAFTNQGEICLCGSRILVHRSQHDALVDRMVASAAALRVGDPGDPSTQVGALVSAAHRDKVEGYLRLAVEEGGTVHGGTRPELPPPLDGGHFLRPAVVTGLAPTCRTATEEIFGPVVSVHPYDEVDEAIALANGVAYGLSASVWGADTAELQRVALALQAGMVWINGWMVRDLRTPFGGAKHSGVGREGGTWSLDVYSELKTVTWCR